MQTLRSILSLLAIAAIAYAAILALAWAFQTSLIYPAPRGSVPVPSGFAEVQLRTADGLELRAFEREAQPGLPTIVHFHGNGGSLAGALVETQALVEAGYGLLLVNYRGYGTNPGDHTIVADAVAPKTSEATRQRMTLQTRVLKTGNL